MSRDIDRIIAKLKRKIPSVQVVQLRVSHPGADDDGVWFIQIPGRTETIQIESSTGSCPFLIEADFASERFYGRSVEEVFSKI